MSSYVFEKEEQNIKFGKITGILTLHGVSKELILQSKLYKKDGKTYLDLTSQLNIKDYNIEGSFMNSDKVDLNLNTIWN